ncbi:MAG: hypothetical protein K5648_03280 [Erysipelotrichaceae bacterium]|nr:hypothetical protein [Erysipelotrichaceae bacterium]
MFLIEKIENALQLICLGILTGLAIYQTFRKLKMQLSLLAMFYGVITLGNLYWFLYMLLFEQTPYYPYISDFCWVSAFLFLLLLLLHEKKEETRKADLRILLLSFAFSFGMCLFYMRFGAYFTNLVYALFMGLLIYYSVCGLRDHPKGTPDRGLYLVSLLYCIVENGLWTASCFDWSGPVFLNPYYFFDLALTLIYCFFYLTVKKVCEQ